MASSMKSLRFIDTVTTEIVGNAGWPPWAFTNLTRMRILDGMPGGTSRHRVISVLHGVAPTAREI